MNTDHLLPRLAERIGEPMASGCWPWLGGVKSNGYGQFSYRGSTWPAHRVTYTELVGEIPEGLVIDHLCRVRHCVNPEHMEPVTCRVNIQRGETGSGQKRTSCSRGHEYNETNTYRHADGRPKCRICDREVIAPARRARDRARKLAASA